MADVLSPSPAEGPSLQGKNGSIEYSKALGALNRRRKQLTNNGALAGVIIFSMVLFILSFATAASWVLSANLGLRHKEGFPKVAIFSACLTVVTIGLAVVFGFTTKEWNLDIPVDTASLLNNLDLSLTKRDGLSNGNITVLPASAYTPGPFSLD
jgi:hypothetical protein